MALFMARPPRLGTAPPPPSPLHPGARTLPGSGVLLVVLAAFLSSLLPVPAGAQPAPAPKAGYAGTEACVTCHEEIGTAFARNPHNAVEKGTAKPKWKGRACESCHGPGAKHAESVAAADIVNPSKVTPAEEGKICLGCHLNDKVNSGRLQSAHAKGQVRCTGCHSVHDASQGVVNHAPAAINQQCTGCHTTTWAQFQKPHVHPVPQGGMSCVSCHNPHGSLLKGMTQVVNANEPGCIRCHGDKRGPFVWEHAPMRLEGCGACHEPHGSANPHMLNRQEVRYLCLECHSNVGQQNTLGSPPTAAHNMLSPRFQNCTICHVKIHGSNVSRDFLR